jgi:hypothetical protein
LKLPTRFVRYLFVVYVVIRLFAQIQSEVNVRQASETMCSWVGNFGFGCAKSESEHHLPPVFQTSDH